MQTHVLYNGEVMLQFDPVKHRYLVNGQPAISVTKALDVIHKPALVPWAAKMAAETVLAELKPGMALNEIEIQELANRAKSAHRQKSQSAAQIGSTVHDWVERFARGNHPPMPLHDSVRKGVEAYIAWVNEHRVDTQWVERKVCSLQHRYVGTVDFVGQIDGVPAVVDFKTSSSIWDEYRLQVAAYSQALIEEGIVPPDHDRWIIRFDKETGNFEAKLLPRQDYERDAYTFRAALALYRNLEEIKAANKRAA